MLASAAALAWLYLLTLHGGYWRTGHRLPPASGGSGARPAVTAIVPARNEAEILPDCLPTLLAQDYEGRLTVIVVDDDSADGTGTVAAKLGAAVAGRRELRVVTARPTPAGWAGKVWAMAEGAEAAAAHGAEVAAAHGAEVAAAHGAEVAAAHGADADYFLFTDADIAYAPGTVERLARAAAGGDYALVSQMALLRTSSRPEKLLVPAFVYFFAQLYPFGRVSQPRSRTAAAAGGCMLVRVDALAAAGGLAPIRDARIDDVALGGLLKRHGGRCWLGLTTDVVSMRAYDRFADIWNMVARSAYTQLRYSRVLTAAVVLGLTWLYLLPPAAAIAGLAVLAAGPGPSATADAAWLAAAGLAGWLLMALSYVPMLRLYRLSPLRGPALPLIAALYAAMTVDSARRHHRGRGGEWKGRRIPPA